MKVNKHFTRLVAGSVSAGILAPSCVPYGQTDVYEDLIYGVNSTKEDLGKIAIPISTQLTTPQAQYMNFLQKLAEDIVKYPVIAKNFAKNPEIFMARYGYSGNLNLDDDLLKVILALGDDDINRAIKVNDAKLFISLCNEKGLLKNDNHIFINNNEEFQKQLKALGLEIPAIDQLDAGVALIFIITVVIALAIAINITAVETKGGGPLNYPIKDKPIMAMQYITEHHPILNVWLMKNQDNEKTYILLDELNNHIIDKMVEAIKANNPSYFENNSEEALRNLLRLNTVLN